MAMIAQCDACGATGKTDYGTPPMGWISLMTHGADIRHACSPACALVLLLEQKRHAEKLLEDINAPT